MSSALPRKRSLSPSSNTSDHHHQNRRRDRDDEDEVPWWERDRNGGDSSSSSSRHYGAGGNGRVEGRRDRDHDNREYDNRGWDRDNRDGGGSRGYRGGGSGGWHSHRGGGRVARDFTGGFRGDRGGRRGGRDQFDDTRRRNSPYSNSSQSGRQHEQDYRPPRAADDVEEGEIPLNYSDAPAVSEASKPNPPPNFTPTPIESPIEIDIDPPVELDPEQVLAERRRKRAEILAKYSAGASIPRSTTPAISDAGDSTPQNVESYVGTPTVGTPRDSGTPGRREVEVGTKRLRLGTESPVELESNQPGGEFDLFKDEASNEAIRKMDQDPEEEVSAADYNPDEDRKEDDRRRAERDGIKDTSTTKAVEPPVVAKPAVVEDDDDDDMFSLGLKPVEADDGASKATFVPVIDRAQDEVPGLTDNFDDAEGYYKLILGETLDNGRYHVHANLGKGMFSGVVRAKDLKSPTGAEVAIKVIRSQESMYKAGQKEANILRKLMEADPTDKKHVVRLERTFEHRGHLCLVFESLSMNLREVVKRFGKDVGINLRAVRAYASQMFLGLALLRKCDIMHADIKPDNILVNESKSVLKICDLGSASDVSENDITPYLVSRFYRAPEIILGLPYDCSLDTWSIGCTLYELYTGKILFPGRTNNHMLLLIMELKGKMAHKMLKRAKFVDQHFDESMNFLSLEKNDSIKTVALPAKAAHDLRNRLMPANVMKSLKEEEIKLLSNFVDLLDKMLNLDPAKRPTPKELLSHPFIRG